MQVIGFEGGSDPPAFQNAERQRMKLSSVTHNVSDSNLVITSFLKLEYS
jgi:transcription factor IIIB subunit 2